MIAQSARCYWCDREESEELRLHLDMTNALVCWPCARIHRDAERREMLESQAQAEDELREGKI